MTAYYNEIDPYAAQWLRNLIDAGQIARGDVDERSIVELTAGDLKGYTQAHFFAGIGGWSIALRLAGWPDDRPVWTGSCPCQPFSAAGKGEAGDDERHLWPAWFPLIQERRPPVVFGEQVEAAIGWGWLDAVFADLEGEGYACGATVLPACGIGAPHIRQRLWFVADAQSAGRREDAGSIRSGTATGLSASHRKDERRAGEQAGRPSDSSTTGAYPDGGNASAEGLQRGGEHGQRQEGGGPIVLGNAYEPGSQGRALSTERAGQRSAGPTGVVGFWSDAEWIACTDGKSRPVGPGSFPLGHGIPRRASKLRAYGNAIVPQVAAEFIAATQP